MPLSTRYTGPPTCSQGRHGTVAFCVVLFSIAVIASVNLTSCWSYLDVSLGMAPVQVSGRFGSLLAGKPDRRSFLPF